MRKLSIFFAVAVFATIGVVSCGRQCETCDCWKNGEVIDNYRHCSGSLLNPNKDHKFYREYMIQEYGLDSVSCK